MQSEHIQAKNHIFRSLFCFLGDYRHHLVVDEYEKLSNSFKMKTCIIDQNYLSTSPNFVSKEEPATSPFIYLDVGLSTYPNAHPLTYE